MKHIIIDSKETLHLENGQVWIKGRVENDPRYKTKADHRKRTLKSEVEQAFRERPDVEEVKVFLGSNFQWDVEVEELHDFDIALLEMIEDQGGGDLAFNQNDELEIQLKIVAIT